MCYALLPFPETIATSGSFIEVEIGDSYLSHKV